MDGLSSGELKLFLDEKYEQFNGGNFIATDPVSVPHHFEKKEDIEISGFLTATIAWGNRNSIIKNAERLMDLMDQTPYEFLLGAGENEFDHFLKFVHRTFNGTDTVYFLKALRMIYLYHGGLEQIFILHPMTSLARSIMHFRTVFFSDPHLSRTEKHVANIEKGASAKRLCMFLRWMVRDDGRGVDFGLWKGIQASQLMLPLDIHTGTVSRKLGLLTRKQNDWKAVEEVTACLRNFDPLDPVKYDFALFGLGIHHEL